MLRGLPLHQLQKDNEIMARNQRTIGIGIMSSIIWAAIHIECRGTSVNLKDCVDIAEEIFAEVESIDPDEDDLKR